MNPWSDISVFESASKHYPIHSEFDEKNMVEDMVKAKLIQSDPFAPLFIPTHEKSLKFL
jgi:hypothetical protein